MLALTTESDQQRAEAMARQLLERGLVACVSLRPVLSLYCWRGGIDRSNEVQLLIKTAAAALPALEAAMRELHSYETPEWLTLPVEASADYEAWLLAELSPGTASLSPDEGTAGP